MRGVSLVFACFVLAACTAADPAPPPAAAKPPEPLCPAGSGWNGAQCVRTLVVTEVTCPGGSAWEGSKCVGNLLVDCPAGTRFVDGVGCVAELSFDAHPPPSAAPLASAPPPAPSAPGSTRVADPWSKPKAPPKRGCDCASGDLMCLMKCAATCKDGTSKPCQGQPPPPPPPPPPSNTGREFDRSAASATLAAASTAAKSCAGASGTGRVRVTFAASGKVTTAAVDGAPFAGTPQGQCITAAFLKAQIPPFDGAPVAVSKSVLIP